MRNLEIGSAEQTEAAACAVRDEVPGDDCRDRWRAIHAVFLSGLPREIPKQYESMTNIGRTCPFRKSYPHVAMMQLPAAPAAHFENIATIEIHPAKNVMIELYCGAIRLVFGKQRQDLYRRIGGPIAKIHECPSRITTRVSKQVIPYPPHP